MIDRQRHRRFGRRQPEPLNSSQARPTVPLCAQGSAFPPSLPSLPSVQKSFCTRQYKSRLRLGARRGPPSRPWTTLLEQKGTKKTKRVPRAEQQASPVLSNPGPREQRRHRRADVQTGTPASLPHSRRASSGLGHHPWLPLLPSVQNLLALGTLRQSNPSIGFVPQPKSKSGVRPPAWLAAFFASSLFRAFVIDRHRRHRFGRRPPGAQNRGEARQRDETLELIRSHRGFRKARGSDRTVNLETKHSSLTPRSRPGVG